MTEQSPEPIAAASEGNATVVVAVQDSTAESERTASIEMAAESSVIAAEIAADSAQSAVTYSAEAIALSEQASQEAVSAAEVAATAADTASQARDSFESLRAEMDERDRRLMALLDERLTPQQPADTPREVVVSNAPTQATSEASGTASGGTDTPVARHRFGKRRS